MVLAGFRTDVSKAFFSEEEKQKTFGSLSRSYPAARTRDAKAFGCFFEKELLLPSDGDATGRHKRQDGAA
jgi:hypothetical protein